MISHRLRLIGEKGKTEDGKDVISATGSSWVELSSNGHRENENPIDNSIIYQVPSLSNDNGRERIPVHGSVEISIPIKYSSMERSSVISLETEEFEFNGLGEIYSFTTLRQGAPLDYEEFVPYTIAIIKLDEGPMVTAQLTDLDPRESIEIGMKVEMVTRLLKKDGDQGMLIHGYKFRPVLERKDQLK